MKTIQLNLYPLSELEGGARDKAIESYRYINVEHFDWWDYIYEGFTGLCASIGLTVVPKSIYFKGFYSQGDGSMFKGDFDLPKLFNAIAENNFKEQYDRAEIELPLLHVDRRVIRLIEDELIDITAVVTHPNRAHYVTAEISVGYDFNAERHPAISGELDKLEKWLKKLVENLNAYLYKTLQLSYEYDTADEAVSNAIEANEYWFTADGQKANRLEGLNFQQSLKAMP
jgi:hypothetical protein